MESTTKNSAKAKVNAALDEALAMDAKTAGMKYSKKDLGKVVCHAKDPNNCRFHKTGKYAGLTDADAFSKKLGDCSKDDIQDYINEALEAKGIKSQVALEDWGDKGNGFKVDWQHPAGAGEGEKWDAKGALEEILPNDASMDAVDDNDLDHSWFHVEGFVNAEQEDLATGGAAAGNENPELEDMVAKEGEYKPATGGKQDGSFTDEDHQIMDAFADVCEGENVSYENPEWDQVDGNLTCTLGEMKSSDKGLANGLAVSMEAKLNEMGYPDADVQVNDADGGFTFVIGAGEKDASGGGSQSDLFGGQQQVNGSVTQEKVDSAISAIKAFQDGDEDKLPAVCEALNKLCGTDATSSNTTANDVDKAGAAVDKLNSALKSGDEDKVKQQLDVLKGVIDGFGEGGLPSKDAVDAAVNAFYDWTQAEKDDMDAVDMCCGALNDLMGKGLTTEDVDAGMLATANEYIEQMASAMDKGDTDAAQQSFEKLQEMFDGIGGDDGQKSPYLPANEADMATGDVVSQTAENIIADKFPNMEISADCEETKPGVYEFEVTGYDTDDDPGELAEELQKALGDGWSCQADGSTVVCTAKTEDGATGNQGKADYESVHDSVSAYLSGKTADDDNLEAKMKACEDLSALTGLTVDPGNVTDDVMQKAQSLLAAIQSCELNGSAGVEELSDKLKDLFQEGAAAGAKGASSAENGAAAGASGQQQEEDEDAYSLNPDCDLSDFLDNAPGLMEKYGDAEGVKDAHDKLQAAYGNYQKVNESIEGMQELVDSGAVPQSVMNQLHDAANGHASECDKHMAAMQGAIKAHKEKLAAEAKTDEDSPALDPNVDFDEFKGKHADALAKKYSSAEGFGVAHDKFSNANKKADEVAKSLEQVKQMAENGLVPQSVVDDLQKAHQGHLDEAKKQMSAMQAAVKAHKAKAGSSQPNDLLKDWMMTTADADDMLEKNGLEDNKENLTAFANAVKGLMSKGLVKISKDKDGNFNIEQVEKGVLAKALKEIKDSKNGHTPLDAQLPTGSAEVKAHAESVADWADKQIDGTQFHSEEYPALLGLYKASMKLAANPDDAAAKEAFGKAKDAAKAALSPKGSEMGDQVPDAVVHALSSGKVANTNGVVPDGNGGAIVKLKPGTSLGQAQNALNALSGELDGFGSVIEKGADGAFQIKLSPQAAGGAGSEFTDVNGNKLTLPEGIPFSTKMYFKNHPEESSITDDDGNTWTKDANGVVTKKDAGSNGTGGSADLDFKKILSATTGTSKHSLLGVEMDNVYSIGNTDDEAGVKITLNAKGTYADANKIASGINSKYGNATAIVEDKGGKFVVSVYPKDGGAVPTGGKGSSSPVHGTMNNSSPATTAANWDQKTGSFFHDTSKDAFDFAVGTKQFDGTDLEKGTGFLTYDDDLGGSILHLPDGSDHAAVGAVMDKLEKKYGNIVAKPVFGNGGKASIEITPKLSYTAQKWAEGMAPKLKNDFGGVHESHILAAVQKALKTNPVQFQENGVNNMGLPQVVAFNKAVQKNLIKAGHLTPKAPTNTSIYPTLGGFSHSEPQKTADGGYELHVGNLTDKTFAKMQPQLEKDHPGFTVSKNGAAVKFTPVSAAPAAAPAAPAAGASASFTGGKKKYWDGVGTDVAKANIKGVPPEIAVKAFEDTIAALPDHAFDENGHMTASFHPNKVIKDAHAAAAKLFEPVKKGMTDQFNASPYHSNGHLTFTPEGAAKITCTAGSWNPKTSKAGIEAAFPGYSVTFTNKNKNAILTKKDGAAASAAAAAPLKGGKFWGDFPKGNLKKYLDQKMSAFTDQIKQFHHGMSKDTITKGLNAAFHEIGLTESDISVTKDNGVKSYTIPEDKFAKLNEIVKDKSKLETLAKTGTPLSPAASAPNPGDTGAAPKADSASDPKTGGLPAAAAKWHQQFGSAFLGQGQFADWDPQHVSDALQKVLCGQDVKFGKTPDGKFSIASKVKGKTLSMLVQDQLADVPKKTGAAPQPAPEVVPTPKVDSATAKYNVMSAPSMASKLFGEGGLTPQEKNGKAIAHLEGLMTATKSADLKNAYQNLIAKLSQQQYDADGNPKA